MEQPTIFYIAVLTLAFAGGGNGLNASLAWIYVALRLVHSLVQVASNRISIRFPIFALSSLVLAGLTLRAANMLW